MLHVVLTSHLYELLLCLFVGFALVRAPLSDHPFYSVFGVSIRMLTRAVTAERLPSREDCVTVPTGVNVSLHLTDKLDIESLSWASMFWDILWVSTLCLFLDWFRFCSHLRRLDLVAGLVLTDLLCWQSRGLKLNQLDSWQLRCWLFHEKSSF